ncbi:MAG: 50S ribosomal protein L29 [Thermoleophilaceae bacterium]
MKAVEVHNMDDVSLVEFVASARQEIFNLRFQHATGQLENTARLKAAKKELARGLTVSRRRGIDPDLEIKRQKDETE